jgi:hypothetical protein
MRKQKEFKKRELEEYLAISRVYEKDVYDKEPMVWLRYLRLCVGRHLSILYNGGLSGVRCISARQTTGGSGDRATLRDCVVNFQTVESAISGLPNRDMALVAVRAQKNQALMLCKTYKCPEVFVMHEARTGRG